MKKRVSVRRCEDYDSDTVRAVVAELWADVCGDEELIKPGAKVLLKPNLLTAQEPERAVTTHPAVVEAVAKHVKALGASVSIGDSPGAGIHSIEELWETTGMAGAAARAGVELVNIDALGSESYPVANPVIKELQISNAVKQYDHIINLPKLKTHTLTLLTLAQKNLFGLVPGAVKAEVHRQAPKSELMAAALASLGQVVTTTITFMDAVVGHEGNGPLGGSPVGLGYLLASRSNMALDAAASRLVGVEPKRVPMLRYTGYTDADAPVIVGDGVPARPLPFKLPRTYPLDVLPAFLLKLVAGLATVYPCIDPDSCRRCGVCVKACPVAALRYSEAGIQFDKSKCISCYCCQELCTYRAITLQRSLLGKLLFRDTRKAKAT